MSTEKEQVEQIEAEYAIDPTVERKKLSETKYSSAGLPVCRLCGQAQENLTEHINEAHGVSLEQYQKDYPGWPVTPMGTGSIAATLSYMAREKKKYSVQDVFGFWWDKKAKQDKLVTGFAEPGPLTPRIDPSYVFDPEYTSVALLALFLKDRVLTVGPTGTGKTSMWTQIGARLNYNVVRINFDAGITRADLIGQWVVKGRSMDFMYGILPSAMVLPGTIIILDEWDTISDECSFVLQRPLEEESQLLIMEKGEEVIQLHEDNLIVSTANTAGMGDDSGLYTQGTKLQNFSQINRYSMTIEMQYLPPAEEEAILVKRFPGLRASEAKFIVQVVNTIRDAFLKGQVSAPLSTRDAINWCEKYTVWGDIDKAARYCFINRMPLEDREVVRGIIKRAFE